ncbi:MAG: hypothetical protein ACKV2T_07510 [Kofleriaceae bacterium]
MSSRWLVVVLLGGCELFANIPDYTATNLDGGSSSDADGSIDAMAECVMSTQCTAPEICVEGECRLCDRDAHCGPAAENVCLPDGRCAALERIAYAAPNVSGGACSFGAPCTIEQAFATAAGSPAIDIVKLGAGTYMRAEAITTTDTVILAGEGATMMTAAAIPLLHVQTGGSLTVVGLSLVGDLQQYNGLCFGATGTPSTLAYFRVVSTMGAYGIGGFSCTIDVRRSTITQQSQIGAYISGGSAEFVNSAILGSSNGGVFLNGTVARVEHSTIAGNASAGETAAGITCGNATETIVSSIFWGNTGNTAIDPACAIDYSVVDPAYVGGTQNLRVDPVFLAAGDFHLQATSPARGAASPASALTVDFDNQARPQGAADCGADQVP